VDIKQSSPTTTCSASVPAEYGGLGGSFPHLRQGRRRSRESVRVLVADHRGSGTRRAPDSDRRTDEQKRRWIPDLARRRRIAAYALTEPVRFGRRRLDAPKARRDGDTTCLMVEDLDHQRQRRRRGDVFAVKRPTKAAHLRFRGRKGTPGFTVGKLEKRWASAGRRRSP